MGTEYKLQLGSPFVLKLADGSVFVKCTAGEKTMTLTETGSFTVNLKNTVFSLSGCTRPVTTLTKGEERLRWKEGTHEGYFTSWAHEFTVEYLGVKCHYGNDSGLYGAGGFTSRLTNTISMPEPCPEQGELTENGWWLNTVNGGLLPYLEKESA